jgi:hypothetical protein
MRENTKFHTIVLPVAPQPDTLAAIFILKKFGEEKYPGIKEAKIESWSMIPNDKTPESLETEGYILIDLGGGRFDHHPQKDKTTASRLVAEDLGVAENPALAKLLEYARRDDMFGRGTVSDDPIDRAFGLSALVYHLNRSLKNNPARVVEIVLPLLIGHYNEEVRRTEELPKEFEEKKNAGAVEVFETKQRDKKLSVVAIESDNPSLPGYLRSREGGKFDVVIQRTSGGYVNILTRPTKRIDLRSLAVLMRMQEATKRGLNLETSVYDLARPGRHPKIKEWYYDRATNSLQNGGLNPREVPPTGLLWEEIKKIINLGLAESIVDPAQF